MLYSAMLRRITAERQKRAEGSARLWNAIRFILHICIFLGVILYTAPPRVLARPPAALSAPVTVPVGAVGGDAAWGDYDRDGDPDLLVAGTGYLGQRVTALLANSPGPDGKDRLAEVVSGLPRVENSSLDWGDCDNDGYLDLLLTGSIAYTNGELAGHAGVYRNISAPDGSRTFALASALPALYDGDGVWGDYDNDGRLDALLTGRASGGAPFTRLYRGLGACTLADAITSLPALGSSSAAWGDYDNDDFLDFVLMGRAADGSPRSLVYHNHGDGSFDAPVSLTGLASGSAAWIDLENDGDLDLLLSGSGAGGEDILPTTLLYAYNGSFSPQPNHGLPMLWNSSVSVGDWNNDGYSDLLLSGLASASRVAAVYASSQGSTFTPAAQISQGTGLAVAWADLDGDYNLDLAVSGVSSAGSYVTQLYRNDSPPPPANTPPAAPTLRAACWDSEQNQLVLDWTRPLDDHITPLGKDITYNLRAGTSPEAVDIASPMALDSGARLLPAHGPAGANTRAVLRPEPGLVGYYYWYVQAVDAALAGGPFSAKGTIPLGTHVAISDSYTMLEDALEPLSFNVLANDNPAYAPLSVYSNTNPANGALVSAGAGQYAFTPPADWSGTAAFTYDAIGPSLYCSRARVSITVTPVPDTPRLVRLSNNQVLEGLPAGTLVGTLSTVDPDPGDTHTYSFAPDSGNHDNEHFVLDGSRLLTAEPLWYAAAQQYTVHLIATDATGLTRREFITINIIPRTPVSIECASGCGVVLASPKSSTTTMSEDGAPVPFALVLRGVSTRPGETLAWTAPLAPGMGTLEFSASTAAGQEQVLAYRPAADRSGQDAFTLRVSDPLGNSDEITITVTILPVNDPPALDALPDITLAEWAGEQIIPLTGLSAGPADEAAQPLTATVTAQSATPNLLRGLRIEADALRFSVADSAGADPGEAEVTVTLSDGQGENSQTTRTFHITITPGPRIYIPLSRSPE